LKNYHTISFKLALALVLSTLIFTGCKEKMPVQTQNQTQTKDDSQSTAQETFSFTALPDVVAKVNGTDIQKSKLESVYKVIASQAQTANQIKSDKELVDMALNELINAELLKQETNRQKITAPKEAVEKQLEMIKSQFPDVETFEKSISEKGFSVEQLRGNIEDQLALKEMYSKEIESKVTISDKMIEDFYNENSQFFKKPGALKASHILVKMDNWEDKAKVEEGRKKIEAILAKVKKGEDFAKLAKTSSEGPSAPNGGDLGYFSKGQMVKPFEDAALALKVGEVSDIVQSNFGFHIIKLFDRKDDGVTPLKEASDNIKTYLSNLEGNKLMNEYVGKLRSTAAVEKMI
jgi:peptidyl-prolyl cis-trans isomerase C